MAGVVAMLEEMTARGVLVPARLRIDQRRDVLVKANGSSENVSFPVPVVDIDLPARDVMQVLGGEPRELTNGEREAFAREMEASRARNALIAGAIENERAATIDASYTPVPDGVKSVSLAEGVRAVETDATPVKTSRSAAPLGPGVERGDEEPEPLTVLSGEGDVPVADEPPAADVVGGSPPSTLAADIDAEIAADRANALAVETAEEIARAGSLAAKEIEEAKAAESISDAQRTRLWTLVSNRKVPHERVREIVIEVTGEDSTKTIPKNLYDAVYATIQAEAKGE